MQTLPSTLPPLPLIFGLTVALGIFVAMRTVKAMV